MQAHYRLPTVSRQPLLPAGCTTTIWVDALSAEQCVLSVMQIRSFRLDSCWTASPSRRHAIADTLSLEHDARQVRLGGSAMTNLDRLQGIIDKLRPPTNGYEPKSNQNPRFVADGDRGGSLERLSLLYRENARVAAAFWDWQHKTLTIFTAGITALLAIEVWIYNNDLGRYMAIPLGAAALLSWLCMRFTERNRAILNRTYEIGKVLEGKIAEGLVQPDELIFTWLGSNPGTYRRLLPRVFKIAVVIFLALTIAAVVHAPHNTVHPASAGTGSVSALAAGGPLAPHHGPITSSRGSAAALAPWLA
jgi:hypothetical protein